VREQELAQGRLGRAERPFFSPGAYSGFLGLNQKSNYKTETEIAGFGKFVEPIGCYSLETEFSGDLLKLYVHACDYSNHALFTTMIILVSYHNLVAHYFNETFTKTVSD
jgi:hypothetical protein